MRISASYQSAVPQALSNRLSQARQGAANAAAAKQPSVAGGVFNKALSFALPRGLNVLSGFIRNMAVDGQGNVKSFKDMDVRNIADTLAKGYAFMKHGLESGSLSAPEKARALEELDSQFEEGLKDFADLFDISANDMLKELGISAGTEDPTASFLDGIRTRAAEFEKFAASDFFRNFAEKDEMRAKEAAGDFDAFAALISEAEEAYDKEVASGKISAEDNIFKSKALKDGEDALFSVNNLAALQKAADLNTRQDQLDINSSEEEIAFSFASLTMAMQDAAVNQGASQSLMNALNAGRERTLDEFIKKQNTLLGEKSKEAEETTKGAGARYLSLSSSDIKSVYGSVMALKGAGTDSLQALMTGFDLAKRSFEQKAGSSKLMRYGEQGADFFSNFMREGNGVYGGGLSGFRKLTSLLSSSTVNISV